MTRSLNFFGLLILILLLIGGTVYVLNREGPPHLYINEILADNSICCPDTTGGAAEFDDWIEIYNAGKAPVDIGGMYLSQDKDKPTKHKIPSTNPALTTIQPGGFLILWADGQPEQGVTHLEFKLDQDGEFLGFYDRHGRTIDTQKFGEQEPNVSFGRSPDGSGTWKEMPSPTPGRPN